jgi:hypothetical protein
VSNLRHDAGETCSSPDSGLSYFDEGGLRITEFARADECAWKRLNDRSGKMTDGI